MSDRPALVIAEGTNERFSLEQANSPGSFQQAQSFRQVGSDHQHTPLVLIADDDPAIRLLVRGSLSSHGYRIHEASDGRSALDAIERVSPDMVL